MSSGEGGSLGGAAPLSSESLFGLTEVRDRGLGPPRLPWALGHYLSWVTLDCESLALSLSVLVLFGKRLRIVPNSPHKILQNVPLTPKQVELRAGAGGHRSAVGHRAGLGQRVPVRPVSVLVLKCSGLPPELIAPPAPNPGPSSTPSVQPPVRGPYLGKAILLLKR